MMTSLIWRLAAMLLVSCLMAGSAPRAWAAPAGDAGHSDAAHGAHDESATDPLAFDIDLALFTAIVFLLLLAILTKFAWRPIAEALDKREHDIAENIAAAERVGEEARRIMAEYEAKLAGAADQVRGMLDEARRDAEHTKEQIVAEAKAAAQVEHDRQMREIQTATDQSLKLLGERSANLAVDLAGKIIRQKLTAGDHEQLIREAVDNFGKSPSLN